MSEQRWEVYERYAPEIARFASRRVEPDAVDDVVAETFAVAWRKLPREGDPLPWLYAVAGKVIHTHRRSHARRKGLLARVAGHHGPTETPAASHRVVEDPQLARAFATLTEREREAICLIAWEGLSNADAARAAGCSPATLAVRYSRARSRLTAALERGAATADGGHADTPCKVSPART
jgi:RNA polymerase sigma-70 factor (ECF subfamily)